MKSFVFFSVCFFLLGLLSLVVYFVSFSFEKTSCTKSSPFECGFECFVSPSISFSMPFFIISLMFLLFDVEILLLFFYPLFFSFSYFSSFYVWLIILLILGATIYEWFKGVLSWV